MLQKKNCKTNPLLSTSPETIMSPKKGLFWWDIHLNQPLIFRKTFVSFPRVPKSIPTFKIPWRIHVIMVYLPTWMVVGRYTIITWIRHGNGSISEPGGFTLPRWPWWRWMYHLQRVLCSSLEIPSYGSAFGENSKGWILGGPGDFGWKHRVKWLQKWVTGNIITPRKRRFWTRTSLEVWGSYDFPDFNRVIFGFHVNLQVSFLGVNAPFNPLGFNPTKKDGTLKCGPLKFVGFYGYHFGGAQWGCWVVPCL